MITLTVEEVAALLKLSPMTVYRELVKRRLPGFKVGNQWRIQQKLLEEWMEEKSGWRRPFHRLWHEFQQQGKRRQITEEIVAREVQASRKATR